MRMEQRLVTGQRQEMRQELRLSARQLQTLRLLQISRLNLEAELSEALAENPALALAGPESSEDREIDSEGAGEDPAGQEDSRLSRELEEGIDLVGVHSLNPDYREEPEFRVRSQGMNGDEDPKYGAMLATPARAPTLEEHLLRQLDLLELAPAVRRNVERLIQSLDINGYLPAALEQVLPAYSREDEAHAREALLVLQSLDPAGVGAQGPADAVLLQIPATDPDRKNFELLLTRHWDDLLHNRLRQIAAATKLPVEDVAFLVECLKGMNPYPAREFGEEAARVVMPDVVFERDPEAPWNHRARALEDWTPRLRVRPDWKHRWEKTRADMEAARQRGDKAHEQECRKLAKYYADRIRQAEDYRKDLGWVRSTLEAVAAFVLARQGDFMEMGKIGLKPLKMDEAATSLGVDVSTISRTVADKMVDTPHGMIPLRFFFSSGISTGDGDGASRHAIQEELRALVDAEDPKNPLSDDALMKALEAKGLKIQRRTVAKYRDELNIPNSRQRVRIG